MSCLLPLGITNDDDADAVAEAALQTVDSDFGRTTDPVRMYMREMGSVELLTSCLLYTSPSPRDS